MGLSLGVSRGSEFPYPLTMTLECDARAGFFCRGVADYSHADGYAGAHHMAMEEGWLERVTTDGRLWLCPACSGKT